MTGPEPDIVALRLRAPNSTGGLMVAESPPRLKRTAHARTEPALYARKANRIAIHHSLGRVVAMIEVVSPGDKDSKHAVASFVAKAVDFLDNGIHFLVIDPFPPGPRDPRGIAQAIWDEVVGEPLETSTIDKPLTIAAFDAGEAAHRISGAGRRRRFLVRCAPPGPGVVRQRPARANLPGILERHPPANPRPARMTGNL